MNKPKKISSKCRTHQTSGNPIKTIKITTSTALFIPKTKRSVKISYYPNVIKNPFNLKNKRANHLLLRLTGVQKCRYDGQPGESNPIKFHSVTISLLLDTKSIIRCTSNRQFYCYVDIFL